MPEHCPNCDTPLAGPWCHACGQKDINLQRPFLALAGHTVAETFDVDGKFFRSMKLLFLQPGKLGQMWMDGQRAARSSPIRMFLFIGFMSALAHALQIRAVRATLRSDYPDTVATLQGESLVFDLSREGMNASVQFDRIGTLLDPAFGRLDGKPVAEALTMILDGTADALLQSSLLAVVALSVLWKLLVWRRPLVGHLVVTLDVMSYTFLLTCLVLGLHHATWGWLPSLSTVLPLLVLILLLHHIYAVMGNAYSLRGWSRLWRTALIALVGLVAGFAVVLGATVLSISNM